MYNVQSIRIDDVSVLIFIKKKNQKSVCLNVLRVKKFFLALFHSYTLTLSHYHTVSLSHYLSSVTKMLGICQLNVKMMSGMCYSVVLWLCFSCYPVVTGSVLNLRKRLCCVVFTLPVACRLTALFYTQ